MICRDSSAVRARLDRRLLCPAAALLLAGCSSHLYQREVIQLGGPQLADYSIRYDSLEGCLLRQQVPMQYRVDRPEYQLMLRAVPSYENAPPAVEVRLRGRSELSARFPGATPQPAGHVTPEETRYVIDSTSLLSHQLVVEVLAGSRTVGTERLSFETHHCRAFGFG